MNQPRPFSCSAMDDNLQSYHAESQSLKHGLSRFSMHMATIYYLFQGLVKDGCVLSPLGLFKL